MAGSKQNNFKELSNKSLFEKEEAVLSFWKEHRIFEKSLKKASPKGEFIFYEGPPTANGKPGIHHLETRAFKDAIPRYRTMRGYHVRRKAGWDTHGLPVEIEVEKELGINNKKDIEKYGIAAFNKRCKESVLRYINEWQTFTDRIGFWVDHQDTYFTFDNTYIESIWHILKKTNEKGLLYKDYKVVPWCPRCGTALSSHELAQGYNEAKDPSAYVRFKLVGVDQYFLAWTTTPWTLPGNVALVVAENIDYARIEDGSASIWLAKERLANVAPDAKVIEVVKGKDLIGKQYEPLYPYLAENLPQSEKEKLSNAYRVYAGDFVSTDDGTGIVHTAVMYGVDDFELGTKVGLPKTHLVGEDGKFISSTKELGGIFVKEADSKILQDLSERGLLFNKPGETIEHTYPFCWRCKTPLIYYARDSWYIRMSSLRGKLINENKTINWEPSHIREGRFGEWLREVKDWAISRERFWGTPLPIWECDKCDQFIVIGSVPELKERGGEAPEDLHRPYIDEVTLRCECGGNMHRVNEVLDVWFDSGAMPFAQDHYPFENKSWVDSKGYPANYICEAIDQTRGWFYTLHAVGALMDRGKAYRNVVCLGHLLDAKGKKMSKSLGNIVEPSAMIQKYGVDPLRYFMYTVNAPGDSKNFDERVIDEVVKKNFGRLDNVLSFYKLYATSDLDNASIKSNHVLDQWILARLEELIDEVTKGYEAYKLDAAVRPYAKFIDDLSAWYLRRSRNRFKGDGEDKSYAINTLGHTLRTLAILMAPATPFFAEYIYQSLRKDSDPESVHLTDWPTSKIQSRSFLQKLFTPRAHRIDKILSNMEQVRALTSVIHNLRAMAKQPVRQKLAKAIVKNMTNKLTDTNLIDLLKDEVNIAEIEFGDTKEDGFIEATEGKITVMLDTRLTPELKEEGLLRELIRSLQEVRKENGLQLGQSVELLYETTDEEIASLIEKNVDQIGASANFSQVVSIKFDGGKEILAGRVRVKIK